MNITYLDLLESQMQDLHKVTSDMLRRSQERGDTWREKCLAAEARVKELETLLRHERMHNHSLHQTIEADRNARKKTP